MGKENLGCSLGAPPAFLEFLHEDFSNHNIIIIHENCAEDYCHTVLLGRDVPGERGRGVREGEMEEGWA